MSDNDPFAPGSKKPHKKPISTLTLREARMVWSKVRDNLHEMENNILKLVRHPDTKEEHMLAAHLAYKKVHASAVEVQAQLRAKYPPIPAPGVRGMPDIWTLGGRDSAYEGRGRE